MKLFHIEQRQVLPLDLASSWAFFSNPRNLQEITPPWLDFRITSPIPDKMYAGLIIAYSIRILPGLRSTWVTEITHVEEPYFFADEQRFGPYRFWHHQHRFQETAEGIEMEDTVHYALPFDPVSRPMNRFFIRRKLQEVFSYRTTVLEGRFGKQPTSG